MRNLFIVSALLAGAVLFGGSPAKAELGCVCVKLGSPTACMPGINACTVKGGGACVLPCDYQPKKAMMRKAKKKKT